MCVCVRTVVSPTGSRPPSRNRNNEMPGDEELGFEAAVAALGKKRACLGQLITRVINIKKDKLL